VPWIQVLPVTSVAFHFNVAFARVRVDAHNCIFGVAGRRCSLLGIVVCRCGDRGTILLSLFLDRIQRRDEILKSSQSLEPALLRID
jgi:hypothetical protein